MRVSMFHTRIGQQVMLATHQEVALERAGVWSALGYTFIAQVEGKPSFSDAEIAGKLGDYPRMTRVAMFHPLYRSPALPWLVRNPTPSESDAACPSFTAALECASTLFRCDLITVPARDMRSEFLREAEQRRVIVLVV